MIFWLALEDDNVAGGCAPCFVASRGGSGQFPAIYDCGHGTRVVTAAPAPKVHIPVPVWEPMVTWLVIAVGVALAVWMGWRRWRRHHGPKVTDREASMRRWVNWVASRWMWDAQNLALVVLVDDTTRRRGQFWGRPDLAPSGAGAAHSLSGGGKRTASPDGHSCPRLVWIR